MDAALNQLGQTIGQINSKVGRERERAKDFKTAITEMLRDLVEKITALKNNPGLTNGTRLQKELTSVRNELNQKNQELDQSKTALQTVTNSVRELENRLQGITAELENKNRELGASQNSLNEKNEANQRLVNDIQTLNQTIASTQNQLTTARSEMDALVLKIGTMNGELTQQISSIETIANEMGDGKDVSAQFRQIGDNITDIINMINSSGPGPTIQRQGDSRTVRQPDYGNNVNNARNYFGGRKRRRTLKRRAKKSMRGGYVYKTNKELENSSSVVSGRSSSRSKSKKFRKGR
jgi:chromosome segregation ATPase